VLNTQIAGYIFGLVVVFLGVRYFRSVLKLRKKISGEEIKFSWNNFRRAGKCHKKLKIGGM
jgi:hypothetical protein